MSYLITSNVPDQNFNPNLQGINKPFSYFNNLQNTHVIPANAEVAVQSVKINKDGLISVNRSNNKFFLYYGKKLSNTLSNDQVTSHVTQGFIYKNGQKANEAVVNIDEFADMVQDSLRRTVYHPNLQVSNINVSGATAEVKRNSSDLGYDGFEMCFQSNSSSENVNLVNNKWETAVFGQQTISIPNGSLVTNNSSQQSLYCVGTEYPLSLTSGSIEIDLTQLGAERDKQDQWAVGLTRCVRNQNGLDAPNYYVGTQEEYWDYMVTCEIVSNAPVLKIFQSLYDPNFGAMVMEEFDYRQSRDEDKGNYVNLNASNTESIRFTGTGEQMKIEAFSKVTGKYETLVDGTNASSVLNLKPINQCCWNMYPKFKVPNGEKIGIMKQDGVNITGHIYGSQNTNIANTNDAQVNKDWWATMVNLGRQQFCEDVDSRFMTTTAQYDGATSQAFVP